LIVLGIEPTNSPPIGGLDPLCSLAASSHKDRSEVSLALGESERDSVGDG